MSYEQRRAEFREVAHLQGWAREIMGKNFIGCEVAETILDRALSPYEKGVLCDMPFGVETLKKYRDTHILVAVPFISVNELQTMYPNAFARRNKSWWNDTNFGNQKLSVGWYLIRKSPVPGTMGRSFMTSKIMKKEGIVELQEFVNAGTLVYMILASDIVCDEVLFRGMAMLTADKYPTEKDRIVVGTGILNSRIEIGFVSVCAEHRTLGCATMEKVY